MCVLLLLCPSPLSGTVVGHAGVVCALWHELRWGTTSRNCSKGPGGGGAGKTRERGRPPHQSRSLGPVPLLHSSPPHPSSPILPCPTPLPPSCLPVPPLGPGSSPRPPLTCLPSSSSPSPRPGPTGPAPAPRTVLMLHLPQQTQSTEMLRRRKQVQPRLAFFVRLRPCGWHWLSCGSSSSSCKGLLERWHPPV